MKKVKILFAIITVVAMLSTVAFAADSALTFGAETVEYTDGESLTISVYSTVDASIYKNCHFIVAFDMDVWTFDMEASSVAVGGEKLIIDYTDESLWGDEACGELEVSLSRSDSVDVTANGKVADLVFTKKAGAEAIGSTFNFANNNKWRTGSASSTKMAYSGTITVKAAEPKYEEMTGEASLDHTSIEAADGTVWNEVAVYSAEFNLSTIVAAKGYGLEIEGVKNPITINGSGVINTIFALYGVADANALDVNTYYWVAQ